VDDVSTCPECGYSPVSLIPYFPDIWVCSKCNYGVADRLSNRENTVQRILVDGRRVAVRDRIKHFVEVQRNCSDPEEASDAATLAGLFELLENYLKDNQDIPDIAEELRQANLMSGDRLHPFSYPVRFYQEEAEKRLRVAESRIRDFHASLPSWHETYEITRERIAARRASKTVAPLAVTPEPKPTIEKPIPLEQSKSVNNHIASLPLNGNGYPESKRKQLVYEALLANPNAEGPTLRQWMRQHSNGKILAELNSKNPKDKRSVRQYIYEVRRDLGKVKQ
jgi:hypothetical protein